MNRDEFWALADGHRTAEKYNADKRLHYLRQASIDVLRRTLVQYRFFLNHYIGDLALLVYRVPCCKLRSSLAEILDEELGNGDPAKAHPTIYDGFLRDIGVRQKNLDELAIRENIKLLDEVRQQLLDRSVPFCIGLRGMGGECLCQIHLEAIHNFIRENPNLGSMDGSERIDWTFWEIHAGDIDKEHGALIRDAINDLLDASPEAIGELSEGYLTAKRMYDDFWDNIFSESLRGIAGYGPT